MLVGMEKQCDGIIFSGIVYLYHRLVGRFALFVASKSFNINLGSDFYFNSQNFIGPLPKTFSVALSHLWELRYTSQC